MHYHSFLFSVMCKCSYMNEEERTKNKNTTILAPSSVSSSQPTTPTNPISPSSSTSQREISTTFFSSPRASLSRLSSSPRGSQALESRSATWIPSRDEGARSGGGGTTMQRIFLPQLKRGKLKRRVTIGSGTLSNSSGSGEIDEADWPPFADEDYIVFCFEEDGAFHVIMEESPRTLTRKLQCEDHGGATCACIDVNNVNHLKVPNRRDLFLANEEADEEGRSSPKLREDGTTQSIVQLVNDTLVTRNQSTESMECIHGSVESTDSSRLDWEEQLQEESNLEIDYTPSPQKFVSEDRNIDNAPFAFRRDCLLPNTMFDEDEVFLSPTSQLGIKMTIDDLLKAGQDSCTGSDESSLCSESDAKGNDQLGNEDLCSESAKSSVSNHSNGSSSSFAFPVLPYDWSGSPVTWPKSGRLTFRKHKSRPACLKCCRFLKFLPH